VKIAYGSLNEIIAADLATLPVWHACGNNNGSLADDEYPNSKSTLQRRKKVDEGHKDLASQQGSMAIHAKQKKGLQLHDATE
jgi:hypothetical protein